MRLLPWSILLLVEVAVAVVHVVTDATAKAMETNAAEIANVRNIQSLGIYNAKHFWKYIYTHNLW